MFTPAVQAALVTLIAAALAWVCTHFGIPISLEVLTAVAVGLVAWLLGVPAGERAARSLRGEK